MPGPVVSNSSPIIHLAKIGHLDLLQDFFSELLIPEAVYEECITEGKDRPEISIIERASWLRVALVTNQNLVSLLKSEIDRGEAESIGATAGECDQRGASQGAAAAARAGGDGRLGIAGERVAGFVETILVYK